MPKFDIQLLLIYNNNLKKNLEEVLSGNLKLLFGNNNANFGFEIKAFYFSPIIGTYNIKQVFDEITS